MMQPLALVLYEKLLPGSQLVNRLQDLNYRVQTLQDPTMLVACAEQSKPMLVLAHVLRQDICAAIAQLKQNSATQHLPVIAFAGEVGGELQTAALSAGVTLLVSETAILHHLSQCLDRALAVE